MKKYVLIFMIFIFSFFNSSTIILRVALACFDCRNSWLCGFMGGYSVVLTVTIEKEW